MPSYKVGDEIEAKLKGWSKYYSGKIEAVSADGKLFTVLFDDGERNDKVKSFHMRLKPGSVTYTAPDGKTFTKRSEYRRYVAAMMYSFKDKKGEKLVKKPGDIQGQGFTFKNLSDCEMLLLDHSDQVLGDFVENCKIVIGPSSESVFIRNAKNCTFYIACKQFRCRDCTNCTVSLYTKTEPIVEASSNMHFYPYMCSYPGQTEHFAKASLIPTHNHWGNVFDFNKGDAAYPEPHWDLVPEGDGRVPFVVEVDGLAGEAENPVPPDALATPAETETGMQSFSIGQMQSSAAKDMSALANAPAPPSASASASSPEAASESASAPAPTPAPAPAAAPAPAPASEYTSPLPTSLDAPGSRYDGKGKFYQVVAHANEPMDRNIVQMKAGYANAQVELAEHLKKCDEIGVWNHSFFPHQDWKVAYSVWEVREGTSLDVLKTFVETMQNNGRASSATAGEASEAKPADNTFHEINTERLFYGLPTPHF